MLNTEINFLHFTLDNKKKFISVAIDLNDLTLADLTTRPNLIEKKIKIKKIYILAYKTFENPPAGGSTYKKTEQRVHVPGVGRRIVYTNAKGKKYIRSKGKFVPLKKLA